MKTKYLVEVETKRGEEPPTCERLRSAVYGCGKQPDIIRGVFVARADSPLRFCNDLFAFARKAGGQWEALDFYNTYAKATNAVKRAKANTLRAFRRDGEFAVFVFCPNTSSWEIC
ncbi:MAG: hypothetical protein J6Q22_09500 [Prevotella sp.]|nr:hypothetical protein [Prevotella sp.]